MKIQQWLMTAQDTLPALNPHSETQWVMVFGAGAWFNDTLTSWLSHAFPNALLTGCTTNGEIASQRCTEQSLVVTAITFERPTTLQYASVPLPAAAQSYQAGQQLAQQFTPDTHTLFLLAPGQNINVNATLDGIQQQRPDVNIVGGLAGNYLGDSHFMLLLNQHCLPDHLIAVGFNQPHLQMQHAYDSGWYGVGQTLTVTATQGNILTGLDGRPALQVYRELLASYGDNAAAMLQFPFTLVDPTNAHRQVIRSVLNIDEAAQGLVLAAEIAVGQLMQLMHGHTDTLLDGAEKAAEKITHTDALGQSLTFVASCFGRKLVMLQRTGEEVGILQDMLPSQHVLTGFYSHGEISPILPGKSELHNQTITIAHWHEV
jgi:hypothetical protein